MKLFCVTVYSDKDEVFDVFPFVEEDILKAHEQLKETLVNYNKKLGISKPISYGVYEIQDVNGYIVSLEKKEQ